MKSTFLQQLDTKRPMRFHDTRSGETLFEVGPAQRKAFLDESNSHGWPSFRPEHVVDARRLVEVDNRELLSRAGTHLGHQNSDEKGIRYCVNLASVAGTERRPRRASRGRPP